MNIFFIYKNLPKDMSFSVKKRFILTRCAFLCRGSISSRDAERDFQTSTAGLISEKDRELEILRTEVSASLEFPSVLPFMLSAAGLKPVICVPRLCRSRCCEERTP